MENFVAVAILALLPGATAQPDQVLRVAEADVLAAIGPEHAALWESLGEVERSRASALAARALADPSVSLEREAPDGQPEQWTWSLSWRPPLDGRRKLRIQAADAGVAAAGVRAERALLELRLHARARFADWSIAHARAQVLERSVSSVDPLLQRAEARAEVGEGSRLEARRLLLAVRALEAERVEALAAARVARATIEALVPGLPRHAVPEIPRLPDPPRGAPADSLLRALRIEVESVALEGRLASRAFGFPEVSIGWQQLEDGLATFDGPVAAIELGLPLFDRNRSQRLETEGRRHALEARIAQREREVTSTWQAALEVYELLRTQASAAAEVAGDADRVVTGAAAAFRLGESDLADFLEALRAAREAELVALELRAASLDALRRLDGLSGDASGAARIPASPTAAADASANDPKE